jgi:succinate dehydrogenase assembly factor 2
MHDSQMKEFDQFLNENDWDIYYWATGVYTLPDHIRDMSFIPELLEHCLNKEKKLLRMPDV